MKRYAALALLGGLLALTPGTAQDRKTAAPDPTPPKPQRAYYAVMNADPVALAEVMSRHFRGEADVIAAPAGSGDAILISGSPAVVPEVLKLAEQLDRRPRTVEVEVSIVEVPAKKDGTEWTHADLAADAVAKAGRGQRIKLTAVEGQPVTSTTGGDKPVTSGTAIAGGGGGRGGGAPGGFGGGPVMQRSISYRSVGTTVKVTTRVGSDDAVAVDLSVQDSRVRPPEAGDETGAASFETATLSTRLSVPAGKSVVAQAVRTDGKSEATLSVVVVTARVVEPGTPSPKSR